MLLQQKSGPTVTKGIAPPALAIGGEASHLLHCITSEFHLSINCLLRSSTFSSVVFPMLFFASTSFFFSNDVPNSLQKHPQNSDRCVHYYHPCTGIIIKLSWSIFFLHATTFIVLTSNILLLETTHIQDQSCPCSPRSTSLSPQMEPPTGDIPLGSANQPRWDSIALPGQCPHSQCLLPQWASASLP